jgi:hypothetical protein
METGLLDKYRSHLIFNLSLINKGSFEEKDCESCTVVYFVFSLSHLKVAFLVLGFGYVLCVIVFLLELKFK